MNEDEQARRYRDQEERSTQQRAALLNMQYFDTRDIVSSLPLLPDILSLKEMYDGRMAPLHADEENQKEK